MSLTNPSQTTTKPSPYLVYKDYTSLNVNISIWSLDITKFPETADILVNCTGRYFEHRGGISKAIVNACGQQYMQNEFNNYLKLNRQLEFCKIFQTSPYELSSYRLVYHIASPYMFNGNCVNILTQTYVNIFKKAFVKHKYKSIVLPFIGTGANSIDIQTCCKCIFNALTTVFTPTAARNVDLHFVSINMSDVLGAKAYFDGQNTSMAPVTAASVASSTPTTTTATSANQCVICMDNCVDERKLDKCGHVFCRQCIEEYFNRVKKQCPSCGMIYGTISGNQPLNGTMQSRVIPVSLSGHESSNTIEITYIIPSGTQGPEHPNPGVGYHGTSRVAFLPDTVEGRRIHSLLRKAFDMRLIFTVGRSTTSGRDNCVTWNDIHHKTSMIGGPSHYGYPDPSYLTRVRDELAAKGIA